MTRGLLWFLAAIPAWSPVAADSPPAWSPDGRWLAVTTVSRGCPELAPGWLFATPAAAGQGPPEYRLGVTEIGTDRSVCYASGPQPLTAPSWRPDGRAIAYGRAVEGPDGRKRLEIVVQESPRAPRAVALLPFEAAPTEWTALPTRVLTWGADGRHLAVPGPDASSLTIIRADTGRVIKTVTGATHPVWSPDGARLAFIATDPPALGLIDAGLGPPRRLDDPGTTHQGPCWASDGRSLAVVSVREEKRRLGSAILVELTRFDVESGARGVPLRLSTESLRESDGNPFVSYTTDRGGDNLFFAAFQEGQASSVVWFLPRRDETLKRFHPVDFSVRVGGLALSPAGQHLALRFGSTAGAEAPVGVWETDPERFKPVVTDDPSRLRWIALLVRTTRNLVAAALAASKTGQTTVDRPSILPVPGEVARGQEATLRLRRLARLGRGLCDRPADGPPADAETDRALREATLYFEMLGENYPAALPLLDEAAARAVSPDERLRLIALRAQAFLGMGDTDRARDVADYLASVEGRRPRRLESTPAGFVLTDVPTVLNGWAAYLSRQITRVERDARGDGSARRNRRGDDMPVLIPFDDERSPIFRRGPR